VRVASFACVLVPASVFAALGPLDESYGMYAEDTDYCLRANRACYRLVLTPEAVVYHRQGASGGGPRSSFRQYYQTRNRLLLMRRHRNLAGYLAFSVFYLSRLAWRDLYALRGGNRTLVRWHLRALRDFYTGRLGMTYQPSDFQAGS
jgi:GT2 family glycosyltransferase